MEWFYFKENLSSNNRIPTQRRKIPWLKSWKFNFFTWKDMNSHAIIIQDADASFGIFCITDKWDIFLNSDWGMYWYAWRSFWPENFAEFIGNCNSDYILTKLDNNYYSTCWKHLKSHVQTALSILIQKFIDHCKVEKENIFSNLTPWKK